ncbi:3-keto-disaccharide hydrolase [Planctomycetes bacterium CA13]
MKLTALTPLTLLFLITPLLAQEQVAQDSKAKSIVLFDGTKTTEWEGREELWSFENGEIVGRTSDENPIQMNTFLVWSGDMPENFELTLWFKIEGGNSGVQYRSIVVNQEQYSVGGYQADIDFANTYAGILYEERGRGILAHRGQNVTIQSDGKLAVEKFADTKNIGKSVHPGQWNEFRIVADGNHIQHFINGTKTVDVIDEQTEKAATDGVMALQLHRGPAMTVRFKNISLSKL